MTKFDNILKTIEIGCREIQRSFDRDVDFELQSASDYGDTYSILVRSMHRCEDEYENLVFIVSLICTDLSYILDKNETLKIDDVIEDNKNSLKKSFNYAISKIKNN